MSLLRFDGQRIPVEAVCEVHPDRMATTFFCSEIVCDECWDALYELIMGDRLGDWEAWKAERRSVQ